ncbi:hypothetical protein [Clostridium butyricum]|uniref:hypothetical protein n=1 Tax=Clostridium butyricum TaxID=1492 RepID=UPI00325A7861
MLANIFVGLFIMSIPVIGYLWYRSYIKYSNCTTGDIVCFILLCIISGIICGIIYGISILTIDFKTDKYESIKYKQEIYALQDSSGMQGRFFLGSGYINNKLQYSIVIEDEYGGKKIQQLDNDRTSLFEDGETYIIAYQNKYTNPLVIKLLGTDLALNENVTRYEIHIPKGSVTTQYNIDLK